MISALYKLAIFPALYIAIVQGKPNIRNIIFPSGDASLRKDREDENFGDSQHITVTKEEAKNARIAVMKFDTSDVDESTLDSAMLRLFIADVNAHDNQGIVKIRRIEEDFDEHDVSWSTFSAHSHDSDTEWIEFDVHNEHKGKTGQVDVTSLMRHGEDLKLAIHMKENGLIKFGSKDHDNVGSHPKLMIMEREL